MFLLDEAAHELRLAEANDESDVDIRIPVGISIVWDRLHIQ